MSSGGSSYRVASPFSCRSERISQAGYSSAHALDRDWTALKTSSAAVATEALWTHPLLKE